MFKLDVKDISLWSLSTAGAKEENTWVKSQPNVYEYSYTTADIFHARNLLLQSIQLPNPVSMLLPLQPLATFIGGRYGVKNGFSEDRQENNGAVNSISMRTVPGSKYVDYPSVSVAGHIMPDIHGVGHLGIIGMALHINVQDIHQPCKTFSKSLEIQRIQFRKCQYSKPSFI